MPNIKSAKKRVKVLRVKSENNKARKTNLKTVLKNANDKDSILLAIKKVDQACAHGLMHKNCAARKKSQLATKLNSL
ncbi:MAG: 30S ribosomal protein S20 [Oscillospiraceae bacterium]|nr:30S ribosomal protein S20 [Oscillospiraceae bacterium]MBQ5314993.1 30S ribosomal protein S20 [Oscillospiraceae bacterium]MBQ7959542.1 30S ribosomal protein S20 [Oscillospiraceae bacterium]MBQ8728006.1 30S ribosomal protein S20 [Oscillospiraceae bacterium]MBR6694960.1 30S ribosomal protein S20 [Oscillospiraceae bacterium]